MRYLLTEKEYNELKADTNSEVKVWVRRANDLFSMLIAAKNYPCASHSYCNGCELESNNTCFRDRMYGK